jgi:hypothetical protein
VPGPTAPLGRLCRIAQLVGSFIPQLPVPPAKYRGDGLLFDVTTFGIRFAT